MEQKRNYSNISELPIDEMLTDEDILKLLKACKDGMEQVVICSLLDGGLTASELVKMKIKSIVFDKLGAYFLLPKDTRYMTIDRYRKVRLFLIPSSTQYIKEYLKHHRYKDDSEARFIYSKSAHVKDPAHTPISENRIYRIVKRVAKDGGVKKKITPRYLRHNYAHMSSSDINGKIMSILGIKEEKIPEESLLQLIPCPNCGYKNVPTNIICEKCGLNLDIKRVKKERDKRQKAIENFSCQRCGECCRGTLGTITATYDDLKKWRDLCRDDILQYCEITLHDGSWINGVYDDGINGVYWDGQQIIDCEIFGETHYSHCPFLRKVRNKNIYKCMIYNIRPETCRKYPKDGICLRMEEEETS